MPKHKSRRNEMLCLCAYSFFSNSRIRYTLQADKKKNRVTKAVMVLIFVFSAHWMCQPADSEDTKKYKSVSAI